MIHRTNKAAIKEMDSKIKAGHKNVVVSVGSKVKGKVIATKK